MINHEYKQTTKIDWRLNSKASMCQRTTNLMVE